MYWNFDVETQLMPTGVLFGQIIVVLATALAGVWAATQWTAAALGQQGNEQRRGDA